MALFLFSSDDLWPNDEYCTANQNTSNVISATFIITTTTIITPIITEAIDTVTTNRMSPNNDGSSNNNSALVIVASTVGGLLGLCSIMCLVGIILILRKRNKVKKNAKSDGFTQIRSNSLFGWYV